MPSHWIHLDNQETTSNCQTHGKLYYKRGGNNRVDPSGLELSWIELKRRVANYSIYSKRWVLFTGKARYPLGIDIGLESLNIQQDPIVPTGCQVRGFRGTLSYRYSQYRVVSYSGNYDDSGEWIGGKVRQDCICIIDWTWRSRTAFKAFWHGRKAL